MNAVLALNPILGGINKVVGQAYPHHLRKQADAALDERQDVLQRYATNAPPEPVQPAYRTRDAIGLIPALLGALAGDMKGAGAYANAYAGGKQQKADRDTYAAQQRFAAQQKALLTQAEGLGERVRRYERDRAEIQDDLLRLEERQEREDYKRYGRERDAKVDADARTARSEQASSALASAPTADDFDLMREALSGSGIDLDPDKLGRMRAIVDKRAKAGRISELQQIVDDPGLDRRYVQKALREMRRLMGKDFPYQTNEQIARILKPGRVGIVPAARSPVLSGARISAEATAAAAAGMSGGMGAAKTDAGGTPGIVSEARRWVGTPYAWGRQTHGKGTDCSGLVCEVLDHPDTTADGLMRSSRGRSVALDELQPGDVLFFGKGGRATHTGIVGDNGTFIHASSGRKRVVEDRLADWTGKALTAKRFPANARPGRAAPSRSEEASHREPGGDYPMTRRLEELATKPTLTRAEEREFGHLYREWAAEGQKGGGGGAASDPARESRIQQERAWARQAIREGAPRAQVAERFKKRTGRDL